MCESQTSGLKVHLSPFSPAQASEGYRKAAASRGLDHRGEQLPNLVRGEHRPDRAMGDTELHQARSRPRPQLEETHCSPAQPLGTASVSPDPSIDKFRNGLGSLAHAARG